MQSTNHLHHEDGSFQEYIALDADYLTVLPDDVDPVAMGPVLCAGLTAYKVCSLLVYLNGAMVLLIVCRRCLMRMFAQGVGWLLLVRVVGLGIWLVSTPLLTGCLN